MGAERGAHVGARWWQARECDRINQLTWGVGEEGRQIQLGFPSLHQVPARRRGEKAQPVNNGP